ncbi:MULTISPECIES: IclR family transcriptional regulator [Maritimibacter]|jgi:DNA-binding IclR family transcriptional regulator|uniref:Transcriptional regulator, IclR family protein n=1 Tax=Maritimibacter alkaliphilus HTCC2654 TaxID=314271 RepID=A3VC23_9RHOB|nr:MULTISPECIES: IclR family transcriptional regulator [Maritimibacter]EAQ14506.1 transcriptional regulator, IclR family protein [Rhodobacterales bacterium HTCC2654] [Maritimibacter alkaliphilus HTCC2654]MBL6427122.1 IclR family transcriptional regulator [Maritimibacter sp.]TYP82403.1 IclR family transcriptional regulator [Maritimibacter alkaliphilus HTCC2654]
MGKDDLIDDIDADGDRKFVTALARGLDVLRCFRPYETNLTNQEIAQRTGLPKPTISRLTHTLRKLDYLVYSERTGTYRLGAGVLALGFGVLSSIEMTDRAREELAALCDEGPNPHITSALAEQHRMRAVYTTVHRSKEAIALTINVGARLPLFYSAIGRAILVGMTEKQRTALVDQGLAQLPDERERIISSVEKGLRDYEEHGLCTGFGEWRKDVNGLAVPVFSLNGDRIYGLNVGGPSFFVEPDQLLEHYAERVKRAAHNLSSGAPGKPAA